MLGRITFWRDSTCLPLGAEQQHEERPLEVVVPYSNPALAAQALAAALQLAWGLEVVLTLVAVHVVPYPSPLECQEGVRKRLEAKLIAVARTIPVSVLVKLVFARDREQAYLALLPPNSLVVIGTKDRWWRTREERFARKLAARDHRVALTKVR
jgi:hypothetical protein